jgi:hypothetical protein
LKGSFTIWLTVAQRPRILGRTDDEHATQIQTDLLLSCDAVLMGRRT